MILMCPGPLVPINSKVFGVNVPDSLDLKKPLYSNRAANHKMATWRSKAIRFFALNFLTKLASDEEADAFQNHLNFELQKSTVLDSTKLPGLINGGGYYAQQMTVASFNHVKDPRLNLPDSITPTLLLKGQYDNQPWGAADEYLKLFTKNQFMLIENAGHALYLDKPDLTMKAIKSFLSIQ